jgi:hypothetical protein
MSKQSTLDVFLNKKVKKKEIFYFYLFWKNQFKPDIQAYWTNIKPKSIDFIELIDDFYICGFFSDTDEKEFKLSSEKIYKNVSYLKSHLQKCIQLKDDIRALPTAYHLLKLDKIELIEFLPIIMLNDTFINDSTVHESLTTLIWFIVALKTKKFKMKKYMYEWILGVIYLLSILPESSSKSSTLINESIDSYTLSMKIMNINGTKEQLKINTTPVRPIKIDIKDLHIEDWHFSAIDYHCNSKFLEYISKKHDNIEEDELKKIIDYNSLFINVRNKNPKEYNIDKWNEIKENVLKIQKYLLYNSY